MRYQYEVSTLLPVAWIHRSFTAFSKRYRFFGKDAILVSHKPVAMYDSRVKCSESLDCMIKHGNNK